MISLQCSGVPKGGSIYRYRYIDIGIMVMLGSGDLIVNV